MCNKRYKNLKNLHKKWKVLPMGSKMCHSNYFHPIHMLTFSLNTIFQQTLEASCGCVLIYTDLLRKHEEGLKLDVCNEACQVRLFQPFSDWIENS